MTPEEELERTKRLIGRRISSRRERIGLSQENLAHLADVNRSHLSDIETGKKLPQIWTLMRIAGVLGSTTAQLQRGLRWTPPDHVLDHLEGRKK